MNHVIDTATLLVFAIYWLAGMFGYIAFCNAEVVHGNVITHIQGSTTFELILLGFVYAVLVGYPFMLVPCRSALNTLLFGKVVYSSRRSHLLCFISLTVQATSRLLTSANLNP